MLLGINILVLPSARSLLILSRSDTRVVSLSRAASGDPSDLVLSIQYLVIQLFEHLLALCLHRIHLLPHDTRYLRVHHGVIHGLLTRLLDASPGLQLAEP